MHTKDKIKPCKSDIFRNTGLIAMVEVTGFEPVKKSTKYAIIRYILLLRVQYRVQLGAEKIVYLFIHCLTFGSESVLIDLFHNMGTGPAATFHCVLVRDTERQHYRSVHVPEVVEGHVLDTVSL